MPGTLAGLRVAVTGGAGFIGSHLVEAVGAAGADEVIVVDDLSTGDLANLATQGSSRLPVTVVEGDVCDPEVAAVAAEADLVFHLAVRNVRASIAHPAENLRVNADGTLAVLEAMRAAGGAGRFVYISSSEIYGVPAAGAFSESTLPAPTTVYGAGKLAGEHVTLAYRRTYGLDTRVVRPFNNFGPRSHSEGDSGEVIPKFILRALARRPLIIHGDGTQTRDFMFVRDTAAWLVRLGLEGRLAGETINIGTGSDVSISALAGLVLDATGSTSPVVHRATRPGDLPRLCADTTRVAAVAPGPALTPFAEGLAATIAHFAAQDVEELLAREVVTTWA
jgi:UDP-glucose 4-epimerase